MSIKYREIFGKRDFTDTIEEYKWNVTKFYYKLYHNMPAETWCQGLQKQKLFEYLKEKYAATLLEPKILEGRTLAGHTGKVPLCLMTVSLLL